MKKILLCFVLLLTLFSAFALSGCNVFLTEPPIYATTPYYPTLPPKTAPPATEPPAVTSEPTHTGSYITQAPPTTPAPILYRIEVNIAGQYVTVYRLSDGGVEKRFICSTGTTASPTPLGTYTIQRQERWLNFPEFGGSWGQYTSNIVDQIWFHSLTYKSKNTYSLNNTAYNKLGSRDSHGCIRLQCGDAYWIFTNCGLGTEVDIIAGTADAVIKQSLKPSYIPLPKIYDPNLSSYVYWDPTDPASDNPWKKSNPLTNPTLPPPTIPAD